MKYVELLPGISSSVLAFGCAKVAGAVGKKESARAIHEALDCGINHFDLARCYGYGEAESFVAKNLTVPRDKVVYATKFGIEATVLARALLPLKGIGRQLNRRLTSGVSKEKSTHGEANATASESRGIRQKLGRLFLKRRHITANLMISSVERSLKQLSTDYLDYLFIHEPIAQLDAINEISQIADTLKKSGKIRALGMAAGYDYLEPYVDCPNAFDLFQMANSPASDQYSEVVDRFSGKPSIFFSLFQGGQVDAGDSHEEILRRVASDFPNSVLICSMMKPEHIRANVKTIDKYSL